MKILLVEGHLALAEMSCRVLEDIHHHEVQLATTAAEALGGFPNLEPELVLVDIHLPDMDGYELARRIRSLPGAAETLLVALTCFGNVDDATARAAGFDSSNRSWCARSCPACVTRFVTVAP